MSVSGNNSPLSFDELLNSVAQLSLSELERFVLRVIELQAKRRAPNLPKDEARLLKKINQGLPPEIQKRYSELNAKRKAETLTPEEHQELLQLTGRIEKSDAERVKYLAKLARVRGTSLTALMKELDIRHPAYE
jgi:hypothetical protein